MRKVILMAVAVLVAITISNCGKETEKVIERVEVQKGSQILSGNDVPTTSLGAVGDYYLNKTTMELYGPKTTEGWGNAIGLKGAQGEKGKGGATILSGITAPTTSQGKIGDWYIDTQNKHLYGPKTESGWGTGISLIGSGSGTTQKADFLVSDDGTTLLQWRNKNSTSIDMTAIPELATVTKIGNSAFYGCGDLSSIKLTEKITTIGHSAFEDCGIEEIRLPKNVTSLGRYVFENTNIKNIYIEATTPPILYNARGGNNPSLGKIDFQLKNVYVPASSLNAYKNNAQWKYITDITGYDPNTQQQVVKGTKLKAMP
ncbi:leucine-rich repeat domain-containing protein [Capnocytophaga genosp. AHN8471]|uniref:leucine-rich repeat domain-containing protein n=1 Tax=Capnocytophaga genosp. AHN8471 TaxID=327574 RepID=UPI001931ECA9|nr:leucine-rich repeat domain-containing protein [Capnocytophaga genosp. AHN8471]MBM0654898.1 leucine-rich repeat domain-containing protein [Capnocytophaga genosp. AHN8471]